MKIKYNLSQVYSKTLFSIIFVFICMKMDSSFTYTILLFSFQRRNSTASTEQASNDWNNGVFV